MLQSLAVALLLVLAGLGLGWPWVRSHSDPLYRTGTALALGWTILSQLVFWMGLAGGLNKPLLGLLILLPASASRPAWPSLKEGCRALGGLNLWCAILGLCALAPNSHVDVQVYHYAFPELYLRHGSLDWTWANYYEGLVGPAHMLYLPALALGGEVAANLLAPLFLWLLLLGMLSVCRSLHQDGGRCAGWLVATSPLVLFQGLGGLVDLPAAAYTCWALAALLRGRFRWTGLWAVQAVAIKLTAGLNLICLALLPAGRRALAWAFVLALLLVGPYWARNAYHTGDPVSPLWKTWRVGQTGGLGSSGKPARLTGQRGDRFPFNLLAWRGQAWQDSLNPLLWAGLALALVTSRAQDRALDRLCLGSAVALVILAPADLRYLLPSLPWWACLASTQKGRGPIWLLPLSCLPGGLVLSALLATRLPALLNPDQYLSERTSYSAYQYLATHARPGQRAYLLGRSGFRCPIDYVSGDARPRQRPAPPIDFYVVDLREPHILQALCALEPVGHSGPLAACSRGEVARVIPNKRAELQPEGVFQARIVSSSDRVVILIPSSR